MKKSLFYFCLFGCAAISSLFAQPILKPSIGIGSLPSDNDTICYTPFYLGDFDVSGLQVGDTASDFTLYDLAGNSINLFQELNSGIPVLMIAGSYTCPVFRSQIASINNVVNIYGNQLKVFVVYTVEAHPDIDTSVYFGHVNTTSQNINSGILYRQPITYGDRKQVLTDMLAANNLLAPVYIDGPCNNWWSFFGPAPNNSYLIDTTGIVFSKHEWYDKYPEDILCDIDSLLGTNGNCIPPAFGGTFTFNVLGADTVYGAEDAVLTVNGEFVNNTNMATLVGVKRMQNNMPPGWTSSLCIDVCYSSTTDTVTFVLPPNSTQPFHYYFFTDIGIDTGHAKVRFRNIDNPNNVFIEHFFGITEPANGIYHNNLKKLAVFPNPTEDFFTIGPFIANDFSEMRILDIVGRIIKTAKVAPNEQNIMVDVKELNAGIYFVMAMREGQVLQVIKLVKN